MKQEIIMSTNRDNSKSGAQQQVFLLALIGLFILRIPFAAGLRFFNIQWEWTNPVYQIGTYLLTAFLIWWEIENLAKYYIDTFAIITIILINPILTLVSRNYEVNTLLVFPKLPTLVIWAIATAFSVGIWLKRSKLTPLKPIHLGWLFIALIAGLGTAIILGFVQSYQVSSYQLLHGLSPKETLAQIPITFIYQIGYAAILEEPLFRGFLWGYLRQSGWHELLIMIFQAGIFMVSHIYYVDRSPISFWIIVPVIGLVLGWLAWRSRTIAPSMLAHGIVNATVPVFGYLIALYRLG